MSFRVGYRVGIAGLGYDGDLQMTIEHLSAALTLAQQIGFMLGYIATWRRTGEAPEFIRVQRRITYYRVAIAALRVATAIVEAAKSMS